MGLPIKVGGAAAPPSGGGGLEMTDVKTGAYTAVANDLVLVDHTASSFSVDLPVSAPINTKIGVLCTGHDSANTDEVTIDPGVNSIVGDHDNEIYLTGDSITLQADGTGVWRTVEDTLIPHHAKMDRSASQNIQTATDTKILLNSFVSDNAKLLDAVNNWIMVRRPGDYSVGYGSSFASIASPDYGIQINAYLQTLVYSREGVVTVGGGHGSPIASGRRIVPVLSGNILELFVWQNSGAQRTTATTNPTQNPFLEVIEIR